MKQKKINSAFNQEDNSYITKLAEDLYSIALIKNKKELKMYNSESQINLKDESFINNDKLIINQNLNNYNSKNNDNNVDKQGDIDIEILNDKESPKLNNKHIEDNDSSKFLNSNVYKKRLSSNNLVFKKDLGSNIFKNKNISSNCKVDVKIDMIKNTMESTTNNVKSINVNNYNQRNDFSLKFKSNSFKFINDFSIEKNLNINPYEIQDYSDGKMSDEKNKYFQNDQFQLNNKQNTLTINTNKIVNSEMSIRSLRNSFESLQNKDSILNTKLRSNSNTLYDDKKKDFIRLDRKNTGVVRSGLKLDYIKKLKTQKSSLNISNVKRLKSFEENSYLKKIKNKPIRLALLDKTDSGNNEECYSISLKDGEYTYKKDKKDNDNKNDNKVIEYNYDFTIEDMNIKTNKLENFATKQNSNKSFDDINNIQCRICYDSEEKKEYLNKLNSITEGCNEKISEMISPCKCEGSVKFVHEKCLKKWIENTRNGLYCEICKAKFFIKFQMEKYTNEERKCKLIKHLIKNSILAGILIIIIILIVYFLAVKSTSINKVGLALGLSISGLICFSIYVVWYYIKKVRDRLYITKFKDWKIYDVSEGKKCLFLANKLIKEKNNLTPFQDVNSLDSISLDVNNNNNNIGIENININQIDNINNINIADLGNGNNNNNNSLGVPLRLMWLNNISPDNINNGVVNRNIPDFNNILNNNIPQRSINMINRYSRNHENIAFEVL